MKKNNNSNYNSNSSNKTQNKSTDKKHLLNDEIRFHQVRVTGDDIESKVVSIDVARNMALEMNMDLMLLTSESNPPVVKICDYKKFLYQQKKKKKEQENNQRKNNKELKEVRFSPNISNGDIETKTKKIKEFIEKGHKVKLDMRFKGRMINHKELGEKVLLNIVVDLEDISKPDDLPKLNGKSMIMILSPKK